jgi:hypothetical protein
MSISLLFIFFIGEVLLIFFLSRLALQRAYPLLRHILKTERLMIFFVSFIYFPGTLIHELSHYIVALILHLHPSEIRLFPAIEGKKVKLGHVLYEKHPHDFIRSILVGVAPFFGGVLSLWLLVQTKLFPGTVWWQTLLFGYLILTVSANMFSSKQDLVDVGYLTPLFLIGALIWYLFPIQISPAALTQLIEPARYFFQTVQAPLLFSLCVHAILVVVLFIVK